MLKISLRWTCRIMIATGALCAAAPAAYAIPINYTMSGVANGSLGGQKFTDAAFAVTVAADTVTVNSLGPGVPCNDPKGAAFTLRGIRSGAITTPISVAANAQWQLLAFVHGRCAEAGPMWTNGRSPQFNSYNLAADIGPVPLAVPSAPPGITVATSEGELVFSQVAGLSFQAQVGAPQVAALAVQTPDGGPTAVPTLSGSALSLLTVLLAGVGAVGAGRRRAR